MYSTWQSFSHALLVDNPLLSYINVRHANFLPPFLTVGEAWDLGPRYTTTEDLAPMRDESAERVSHNCQAHIPIKGPDTPIQVTEPVAAVPVHSLTEADLGEEMVTRRNLSVDWFLPSACPAAQSQQPLSRDRTPPPPFGHAKKKKCIADHPPKIPSDTLSKTPPRRPMGS